MKKVSNDPAVKFFISVIGLFVIFFVLKELQHIFIPFVIAYFLFFFFEPLNDFFESKKIPIPIIIFINLFLTISILYGVSRIIINSFVQFGSLIPAYEVKLNHIVSITAKSLHLKERLVTNFDLSRILHSIDYAVLAGGIFSSTLSIVVSCLLTLFFFIFISSGHNQIFEAIRMRYVEKGVKSTVEQMKKQLKQGKESIFSENEANEALETMTIQRELRLRKTFKDITEKVQRYIITKFLISLSVGLIVGIILRIFNIEFFILWAAFAVLLNFIPNIGSVIAVILPSLMALVQYESFGYAIFLAVVLIIVQNIIGNIIEPKIFGDRLGLNPLVILLSLLLWGYIWGIIGMFLSVPLTAIIKIVFSNYSSKKMRFINEQLIFFSLISLNI
jgi:predicted PurR-regulated permease PerM